MPGGRPTDYKEEYCDEIIRFFSVEPFKLEEFVDTYGNKKVFVKPEKFPTFERFATNIGVSAITLKRWAEDKDEAGELKHPEFCQAYTRARDLQAANMIEGGMGGSYSGPFTVLAAKNIIAWRDKQDMEMTGSNGGPIKSECTMLVEFVKPSAKIDENPIT